MKQNMGGMGESVGYNTFIMTSALEAFNPKRPLSTEQEVRSCLAEAYNKPPSPDALNTHKAWSRDPNSAPWTVTPFVEFLGRLETNQINVDEITPEPGFALDVGRLNKFLSKSLEAARVVLELTVDVTSSTQVDIPVGFYENIPIENREMDLTKYKTGITQACQDKALQVAQHFMSNVLSNNHCFYTIQGPAGIGKTAIAVATAKKLAENGKKVLFLSEVELSKLTAGFSHDQYLELDTHVAKLIAGHDAVFMDDNNLESLVGKSFERIVLKGFFESKNLSVFKTSNLGATHECFKKNDKGMHPPSYTDSIWDRVQTFRLEGKSLRKGFDNSNVIKEKDDETLLSFKRDTQECNKAVVIKGSVSDDYTHVGYSESPMKYIPLTPELMEKPSFQLNYDKFIIYFDYLKVFVETLHDLDQKKLVLINKTTMSNEAMIKEILVKAEKNNDIRFLERFQLLLGYDEGRGYKPTGARDAFFCWDCEFKQHRQFEDDMQQWRLEA